MRRRRHPAMSIAKRATTWMAVMVAAVTTATVVAASPSFATSYIITATNPAGYATFNEQTGLLTIMDTHADGKGVAVPNFRSDVGNDEIEYYGWDRNGNGVPAYYQLHMAIGATISFHVCTEDDGLILAYTCGARGFGTYSPII